jgi:CRISPR system Cascade subunit CasE
MTTAPFPANLVPPKQRSVNINHTTLFAVDVLHPTFAKVTRWDDRDQVHQAVMDLFPPDLPGAAHQRRAASDILFRLETQRGGTARVLVQANTQMRETAAVPSLNLGNRLNRLYPGQPVRFRLEANPVRVRARGGRNNPKSGQRIPIHNHPGPDGDTVDELTPWLIGKLTGALTDIHLIDLPRVATRRTRSTPLHTVTFDGTAHVDDPAHLRHLIRTGVGRAKSYGCGLLSVI